MRRREQRAFTLLELMVALAVMSVAIIALLRVVLSNVNAVGDSRDRTIAAQLVQAKINDIAQDPDAGLTTDNSGNFGEEHARFSWTSQLQETQWPELKRLAVTVVWVRGKAQKQMTVETMVRMQPPADSTTGAPAAAGAGATTPGGVSR